MFHPVGPQPPSVYWRRRLILFGSIVLVLVLLVLTIRAVWPSKSSDTPVAAGNTSSGHTKPTPTHDPTHPKTPSKHPSSHTRPPTTTTPGSDDPKSSSAAPPPRCTTKDLDVSAVVAQSTYHVGDQPVLEMQVLNVSAKPCVQDLADKQIELRVYNGESRVWGSHDCQIQPGTDDRTLAPGHAVRVSITWSGLTSHKGCTGTRQRVGAGTYTLYPLLSGHTGKATQFSIT